MNNTSLEALKAHLFETLEGIKNLNDPVASDNEKISIDQAKAIVATADSIIDIYKVQLEGIQVAARMDNVNSAANIVTGLGLVDGESIKKIGM